jgi:hypothetical protein
MRLSRVLGNCLLFVGIYVGIYLLTSVLLTACSSQLRVPASGRSAEQPARGKAFEDLPRSVTREDLITDLLRLYPHLSQREVEDKIKNSTDAFMMYRGLVPYYFDLVLRHQNYQRTFSSLLNQRGWMMGDVHPENFGILLDKSGRAIYSMNDPDDSGPGPLFLETFRYFVALELQQRRQGTRFDSDAILTSYLEGLGGRRPTIPVSLIQYFKKSEKDGRKAKSKLFDKDRGELIPMENRSRLEDPSMLRSLKTWTEQFFKGAEFKDALEVNRDFGGSAFLKRYWVLVRMPEDFSEVDSRWQILEFKGIGPSGSDIVRDKRFEEAPSARQRIETSLDKIFSLSQQKPTQQKPSLYRTCSLLGDHFYVRPRWEGINGLSPSDLKGDAVEDLFHLQATTMGQLQATSLSDRDLRAWLAAWKQLDKSIWKKHIKDYADYFEALYHSVKY